MKSILTFIIAITAIGLLGAAAYAVEVPVDEERFDTSILNCQEMEESGNLWCVWKPINNSGYTGNQTNVIPGDAPAEPETKECPDRFYLDDDGECYPIPTPGSFGNEEKTPSKLEFFDDLKVTLEKECANGCKPSEQKLLEVLQDPLTFCFDGDKTSVYIQSPGATIDPTGVVPHETDNDSNHWLDILKGNREKCKADVTIDEDVHTDFHRNKAILHWWDKVNTIPEWRESLRTEFGIEYPTLTEEHFDASDEAARNKVCYNDLYGNNYKIQFGCPEDSLYKPTDHEEHYAYNGTTSKLNPKFDINTHQNWRDYERYMSGDHSQQLQKAIKVNAERNTATATNYGGQR